MVESSWVMAWLISRRHRVQRCSPVSSRYSEGDGQAPIDRSGPVSAHVQDVAVEQREFSVELAPDSFLAVLARRQDDEIGAQESEESGPGTAAAAKGSTNLRAQPAIFSPPAPKTSHFLRKTLYR